MATAKTANDVASLFLIQKLEDTKVRMERWCKEVREAEERGEQAFSASFVWEVMEYGTIRCIISTRQGTWLYNMIAKERHTQGKRILSHTGKAFYQGREVGSWHYGESHDQYEHMEYCLHPAFIAEYMKGIDREAIAIATAQVEKDLEKLGV